MAANENLGDSMINLSTAALIWVFGVLVFLPLPLEIDPSIGLLISVIVLSAFSIFLIKGLRGLCSLLDVLSGILARQLTQRRKVEETNYINRAKTRIKLVLTPLSLIIVYLLYSPLLIKIHPSINGIAIIITILAACFILLKVARSVHRLQEEG